MAEIFCGDEEQVLDAIRQKKNFSLHPDLKELNLAGMYFTDVIMFVA
jgi:hypothetical protein